MLRKGRVAAALAAAISGLFIAEPAAQTGDTRTMQVTANVRGSCRFEATPNIDFGELDPALATDKEQSVDVTFKCTKGVSYQLTVGDGLNFSGGTNRMAGSVSTDFIAYEVTPKTLTGAGKGFGVTDTIQVRGTVRGPSYENVSAGSYADTVTLSIQP
jgi:spore coat protein U-like protein